MAKPPSTQPVFIAELRDHVLFVNAQDVIDPTTHRSVKKYTYSSPEYANITPIGTQQFYENFNTELEATHVIYTRYRQDASAYQYLMQRVTLPDNTLQEILYEIVRLTEWDGRRIFSRFDCRLIAKES